MKARFLALAALALGLASCQTEPEGLNVNVGGEVDTTITVSLPETTRATDSAEGAFENVDLNEYTIRYILQVYYKDEPSQERLVQYTDGKEVTFDVRLVPGRDYNFVVWADIVEGNDFQENEWDNQDGLHYNTTDLHNITLKQTWVAMDETRDAFTGYFNTAEGDKRYSAGLPINITLTRPFAKLRVITTDMVELGNLGIAPYKGTVTYSTKHRTSFNACNGSYGEQTKENVSLTYNIASYDDNNVQSKVLFTDYFFAQNDVVKFTMDIMEANGTRIKENNFSTDIYVKRNYLTTIQGNILTDGNNVTVTVEDAFDGYNTFVDSAALAQEALDNAAPNTTIYLEPDVDYGTLYLRPVAGASNTTTDCDYLVYRNEMLRKVENLTIVGAPGATVDAIKVVAGYVENSGSTGYVVDIKNLTIDGVEFNDTYTNPPHKYAAPIFFDLTYTNVDGLTVKNCKLIGNNNMMNFVYLYGSGNPANSTFETAAKNIVIDNNTVDGIARLCELRQTENVTITNNTIKNTYLHGMLLTVDGGTYSGNVTITNNTAEGIKERFVRMAGAANAEVVIKNNTIKNYLGEDDDYIKVTDGTNITVENNTLESRGVQSTENLKAALEDAVEANQTEVVIDANNAEINLNYGLTKALVPAGTTVTIRNAVVEGRSYGNGANGTVIFENCTFNNTGAYSIHFDNGNGKVIFKNCNLFGWNSFGDSLESVSFEDCTLSGNGTYALIRSYANLSLTNCVINTTNADHTDGYSEGVEAIEPATLTETNVQYVVGNAAALNWALNNESISIIYLNPGEFGTVVAKNNKTIIGCEGTKVDCVNLCGADNITLKNIAFDAATAKLGYDNNGAAKQYANIITGDDTNKQNKGSHNVVIDGCTFTGTFANGGAAIAFTDYYRKSGFSGNITIKNCTFEQVGAYYNIYGHYTGDSLNGHGNFVIENNTFNTVFTQGGAIYLGRYASNVPVEVKGNTFNVATSLAEAMYVQDHSNYGVSINATNNTFAN